MFLTLLTSQPLLSYDSLSSIFSSSLFWKSKLSFANFPSKRLSLLQLNGLHRARAGDTSALDRGQAGAWGDVGAPIGDHHESIHASAAAPRQTSSHDS